MLGIYNKVVEILGEVPPELEFMYVVCTVLLFGAIIVACLTPWIILFRLMK